MGIQVNPLFFASVLLAWVVVYHVVYSLIAIVRDTSLICWSVGLLGISIVQLEEPPLRQLLAQFATRGVALATRSTLACSCCSLGRSVDWVDSVRVTGGGDCTAGRS